ncbi:hypothetical protein TorRG33x02_270960 [Trema orientale]|uniref:Uncharacterized protein n=1 Tax=Trema orientale TaxID=63057 RepID=A0A2P5CWA0_TREOI|nr:hypothetical protein TorRG33x02_270960 [Trema orientale]
MLPPRIPGGVALSAVAIERRPRGSNGISSPPIRIHTYTRPDNAHHRPLIRRSITTATGSSGISTVDQFGHGRIAESPLLRISTCTRPARGSNKDHL